jgi:hypothetical protein
MAESKSRIVFQLKVPNKYAGMTILIGWKVNGDIIDAISVQRNYKIYGKNLPNAIITNAIFTKILSIVGADPLRTESSGIKNVKWSFDSGKCWLSYDIKAALSAVNSSLKKVIPMLSPFCISPTMLSNIYNSMSPLDENKVPISYISKENASEYINSYAKAMASQPFTIYAYGKIKVDENPQPRGNPPKTPMKTSEKIQLMITSLNQYIADLSTSGESKINANIPHFTSEVLPSTTCALYTSYSTREIAISAHILCKKFKLSPNPLLDGKNLYLINCQLTEAQKTKFNEEAAKAFLTALGEKKKSSLLLYTVANCMMP